MAAFASRFEGLPRTRALLVLAALACLIFGGMALSVIAPLKGPESVISPGGQGDFALYQSVAARVRSGEDYYAAAAAELRARHYALKPALNFRLPTLAWTLAALPSDAAARWLIAGLTWIAFSVWGVRFARMGFRPLILALLLLATASGSFLGLVSTGLHWHELWSGLFVMIALGVYGPRTWGWSALAALAAVLIRELALPLPVILAGLALWNRRYKEAAVWTAVILVFGAALAVHLQTAAQHIGLDDLANAWSAFGGWNFILSTARWNYALVMAPTWLLAIIAPLAILGLAGWKDPVGLRAAALFAAWASAFMVFGRADNHYWGLIYSPLIAIGLALAPFSLIALARSFMQPALPATTPVSPR